MLLWVLMNVPDYIPELAVGFDEYTSKWGLE